MWNNKYKARIAELEAEIANLYRLYGKERDNLIEQLKQSEARVAGHADSTQMCPECSKDSYVLIRGTDLRRCINCNYPTIQESSNMAEMFRPKPKLAEPRLKRGKK